MIFATSYLPHDLPKYWEVVASFANQQSDFDVSPDFAKITMENKQILYSKAFCLDAQLELELISMDYDLYGADKHQLRIPLIPSQSLCVLCGGNLLLRSGCPSRMTLYTDTNIAAIVARDVDSHNFMDTTNLGAVVCTTMMIGNVCYIFCLL